MAVKRYTKMLLLRIYFILALVIQLVDGARWITRNNYYISGIGQDVVMECTLEPGSNFTGFYRKSTGVSEVVDGGRTSIEQSDNTVTLEVGGLTEDDFDTFFCNDTSGSDYAVLEIQASLETNPKSPQILLAGDPGEIKYRVYGRPRPRSITWKMGSSDRTGRTLASIDESGKVTDPSGGRYDIDGFGNLKINKISADDNGEYFIIVKTSYGSRLKGNVQVKVEFYIEYKRKPPVSFVRAVGQDLFIPCEFLYADSEVKWEFKNKAGKVQVIKEGVVATGLNLTSVTMESEGLYTCSASNQYGHLAANSTLKQVIDPARITSHFSGLVTKELMTPYKLVCVAAGHPKPEVTISKYSSQLKVFQLIATGSGETSKSFSKLEIPDAGLYSCFVDNGARTLKGVSMAERKNITLEVYASTVIRSNTKRMVSAIGLNFTIECSAKGYPYPKVRLMGGGVDIATHYTDASKDGTVTTKLVVVNAQQENFSYSNITCFATNQYGTENRTIPLQQIRKAPCPTNLHANAIGLYNIDLQWDSVEGADRYHIDINGGVRKELSKLSKTSITQLKRKTTYVIKIASVNLAGVGKFCQPKTFETVDIVKPTAIAQNEFELEEVTSRSATISWKAPSNILVSEADVLTYDAKYCIVSNDTKVAEESCKELNERKEKKIKLNELQPDTTYQLVVTAINQQARGENSEPYQFNTHAPTPAPVIEGPPTGDQLSSGEIAGIIVAIILIVLIVIDVFCCFFNNCGFSHCCFETFCAAKDKKYLPADSNDNNGTEAEGFEEQEMEEKSPMTDVV